MRSNHYFNVGLAVGDDGVLVRTMDGGYTWDCIRGCTRGVKQRVAELARRNLHVALVARGGPEAARGGPEALGALGALALEALEALEALVLSHYLGGCHLLRDGVKLSLVDPPASGAVPLNHQRRHVHLAIGALRPCARGRWKGGPNS